MRGSGLMTRDRVRAMRGIVMAMYMRETLQWERHMERESIIGRMERSMMESGARGLRRAMACGRAFMEIAIWGSGVILRHMDMGCISGRMEIGMRAVGIIA